jgi:hypothetical protein
MGIDVELDAYGDSVIIRRHGPDGPWSIGTKGFFVYCTALTDSNRDAFDRGMKYLEAAEQADAIWARCIEVAHSLTRCQVSLPYAKEAKETADAIIHGAAPVSKDAPTKLGGIQVVVSAAPHANFAVKL